MTTPKPCSRCRGPRDKPDQRYCRSCRNAANRERNATLKACKAIVKRAGIVVPVSASDSGFANVPAERMDRKREIGQGKE